MRTIERRPSSGGGSCDRCRSSLTLASMKVNGVWFCSNACAQGRVRADERTFSLPETQLYARPKRHFRARRPKELHSE